MPHCGVRLRGGSQSGVGSPTPAASSILGVRLRPIFSAFCSGDCCPSARGGARHINAICKDICDTCPVRSVDKNGSSFPYAPLRRFRWLQGEGFHPSTPSDRADVATISDTHQRRHAKLSAHLAVAHSCIRVRQVRWCYRQRAAKLCLTSSRARMRARPSRVIAQSAEADWTRRSNTS